MNESMKLLSEAEKLFGELIALQLNVDDDGKLATPVTQVIARHAEAMKLRDKIREFLKKEVRNEQHI